MYIFIKPKNEQNLMFLNKQLRKQIVNVYKIISTYTDRRSDRQTVRQIHISGVSKTNVDLVVFGGLQVPQYTNAQHVHIVRVGPQKFLIKITVTSKIELYVGVEKA